MGSEEGIIMSWEDIVKRKKMIPKYKKLIDDVVQGLDSPTSSQDIYAMIYDKFEEMRYSGPRVLSGRNFPEIGALRQYLKVNYKPTAIGPKGIKLYGGKE